MKLLVTGGAVKNNMDVMHTILQSFGWKPEVDFKTGLEKTIAWYRDNESWWKSKKK